MRKGDCMQTYSGKQFFPLDPRPEDIDIVDIAHALSMMCRFNGHCKKFYSVAEHSIIVSDFVDDTVLKLEALLHDAAEAYIQDIVRPVKPMLVGYKDVESKIEEVIAEKFNLNYPFHWKVKEVDNRILHDEKLILMNDCNHEWSLYGEPLGIDNFFYLSPDKAEWEFLSKYHEYESLR